MNTEEKLKILKHLDEDPELKKKVLKYTKQGKSLEVAYNLALTDYPDYDKFEVW
jgi:hypothetical protein